MCAWYESSVVAALRSLPDTAPVVRTAEVTRVREYLGSGGSWATEDVAERIIEQARSGQAA